MIKMPKKITLKGNFVTLEPLNVTKHGEDLWMETGKDIDIWQYLFSGPFNSKQEFLLWLQTTEANLEKIYFACVDKNGKTLGALSFMNIALE